MPVTRKAKPFILLGCVAIVPLVMFLPLDIAKKGHHEGDRVSWGNWIFHPCSPTGANKLLSNLATRFNLQHTSAFFASLFERGPVFVIVFLPMLLCRKIKGVYLGKKFADLFLKNQEVECLTPEQALFPPCRLPSP